MKKILLALSIAAVFTFSALVVDDPASFGRLLVRTATLVGIDSQKAAVFFVPGVTVGELQGKYEQVPATRHRVRILVMPGHEPNFGGAEYRDLKERDMTVELANSLAELLRANSHYDVIVPRSSSEWNEPFATYFKEQATSTKEFAKRQRDEMARLMNSGELKRQTATVYHNDAPSDVALRIYGINKWANENDIDIAIHVHFNDNPRRNASLPGEYAGISIYVPEKQYSNSATTKSIADAISKRLTRYYPTSNMPQESDGIVEDQDLIAIGSHNSSDAPSMLIEYGYIYEPQFQRSEARHIILKDMAFQTYLGLQDFFGSGNDVTLSHDNLILPHTWDKELSVADVVALQTALSEQGLFPPEGETKVTCPRTGKFGPCTIQALEAFQKKYEIAGEKGKLGEKTRTKLNEIFGLELL